MTLERATALGDAPRARRDVRQLPARAWQSACSLPLIVRYGIVSGAIGVPGSILQLMVLIIIYRSFWGEPGTLALNALWLVNFELGLLRNFALHCLYTWITNPTWKKLQHAHVAASGAIVIDLIAFNAVVYMTHWIPLAQLLGAASGFVFNFTYNKLKTFSVQQQSNDPVGEWSE